MYRPDGEARTGSDGRPLFADERRGEEVGGRRQVQWQTRRLQPQSASRDRLRLMETCNSSRRRRSGRRWRAPDPRRGIARAMLARVREEASRRGIGAIALTGVWAFATSISERC